MTGGQYVAHEPVHLDDVAVSIANQYSVLPWALTSTVPMLVLRVPITAPDVAAALVMVLPAAGAEVLPELLDGDAELPHAASITTAPASTGAASHRLCIFAPPFLADHETFPRLDYVDPARAVHLPRIDSLRGLRHRPCAGTARPVTSDSDSRLTRAPRRTTRTGSPRRALRSPAIPLRTPQPRHRGSSRPWCRRRS